MAIVIVEPSSSGFSLLDAAESLGETVYVLSADKDDRKLPLAVRQKAHRLVRTETHDPDCIVQTVNDLGDHITALIPGFEYVVDSVSRAGATLGLPHLNGHTALQARNKHICRQTLASLGLLVPRFQRICNLDDAEKAAKYVGFPSVLKPVDGCGSLFVKKIHHRAELDAEVTALLKGGFIDMGLSVGSEYLLEEYIAGQEFSVEGYIGPEGPIIVAVTEKILGDEPYFVEMGHVVEANLPPSQRQAVEDYIHSVVTGINMNIGVFHAELRLSERGPVLMEIAARLGGDRIHRLVEIARGISLPQAMIRCYQNRAPLAKLITEHRTCSARFFTSRSRACTAVAPTLIDQIHAFSGFEEFEIYYEPGTRLPALTDFRGRLGHIILSASDRTELDANMNEALAIIAQAIQ